MPVVSSRLADLFAAYLTANVRPPMPDVENPCERCGSVWAAVHRCHMGPTP